MNTFISILRGINVSGKNKILMKELKELYISLCYENVITYILSGNIIFNSTESDEQDLSHQIKNAISEKYGYDIPVLVLNREYWLKVIREMPYRDRDNKFIHVTFLEKETDAKAMEEILKVKKESEEIRIIGTNCYLYCPDGYGKTKLSNQFLEKKLKVTATTRNWKTVCKIGEMLTDQTV